MQRYHKMLPKTGSHWCRQRGISEQACTELVLTNAGVRRLNAALRTAVLAAQTAFGEAVRLVDMDAFYSQRDPCVDYDAIVKKKMDRVLSATASCVVPQSRSS